MRSSPRPRSRGPSTRPSPPSSRFWKTKVSWDIHPKAKATATTRSSAREQYARGVMSSVLTSYFDGSLARMVSFFSRNEDISVKEMDEILEIMRNAKK